MKNIVVTVTVNLYSNQHGIVQLVTDFFEDGSYDTSLWVRFNDGLLDEHTNMQKAMDSLQ